MNKNKTKWLNIAPDAKDDGKSEWKTIEQIKEGGLNWSSNGNGRHGKFLGLTEYIWEVKRAGKGKIVAIRTIGMEPNIKAANRLGKRRINTSIDNYWKKFSCIHCGSNKDMCVDHKNDLYNDERVHNVKTQRQDDFQPLCRGCNLIKRAVCKKTKEQNKRQALFAYTSLGFPAFIEGDETFDPNGLGMRGTYWYDIKAYRNHCKTRIIQQPTSVITRTDDGIYNKVRDSILKYCKKKNLNISYIVNKLIALSK